MAEVKNYKSVFDRLIPGSVFRKPVMIKAKWHNAIILMLIIFVFSELCFSLEIGTVDEPPGNFKDEKGIVSGLSVDFVKEIQNRVNDTAPIQMIPGPRLIQYSLTKKNFVLFSLSRTKAREHDYHWISLVMRKPLVLFVRKESTVSVKTIDDAKKLKKIGVMHASVTHDFLKGKGFTNLFTVTEHVQNLKMLMAGRVDAIYTGVQNAAILCKDLNIDFSRIEPALILQISNSCIAMSKTSDIGTVKAWQNAAQQIKEDGTFDRLARKWMDYSKTVYGIECEIKDGALNFWQGNEFPHLP